MPFSFFRALFQALCAGALLGGGARLEDSVAATPFLEFKPLAPGDLPLATAIAENERRDDPDGESFGLDRLPGAHDRRRVWGLWIKGALSGAVWVESARPDSVRVPALALGRGWRDMGLVAWMLSDLAETLRAEGVRHIRVDLAGGGRRLGEGLTRAGFVGPDEALESYPAGSWLLGI
ncbi:MAG: hypothetical protein LBT97_03455 [Planctomycetota bacterium]|nr:hypothetical protein [Planctomycetota bacterium]